MQFLRPVVRPVLRGLQDQSYGRRVGFYPATLYVSGQAGLWYEPSTISTLYQDNAGTTAVTASGQQVGKESDKSGRANHAFQATGPSRPTYTVVSSIPFLAYDGVDDGIATAGFATGTLTADMDCFIAIKRTAATSGVPASIAESAVNNLFGFFNPGSGISATFGSGSPTYAVNGVDVAGGTATTAGQLEAVMPINNWLILETRNVSLSAYDKFCISSYPTLRVTGQIGSVILCPAQSTASRNSIRTYMGNQVGLTL